MSGRERANVTAVLSGGALFLTTAAAEARADVVADSVRPRPATRTQEPSRAVAATATTSAAPLPLPLSRTPGLVWGAGAVVVAVAAGAGALLWRQGVARRLDDEGRP